MNNSTLNPEAYSPDLSFIRVVFQSTYLFLGDFFSVIFTFHIVQELWRDPKCRSVGSFYLVNLAASWMLNVISLSWEINVEAFNEPVKGMLRCYIYPTLIRIPGMAESLFLSCACMERSWNWKNKKESTQKMLVEYGLETWGLIIFAEVYCFICGGKEIIPLRNEEGFHCFVVMQNPKLQAFFITMYITIRCFAMACIFLECCRAVSLEGERFVLEPSRQIEETPMELEYKYRELRKELAFVKMAFGSRLLLDFFDGTMLLGRTSFSVEVRQVLENVEMYLKYGTFLRSCVLPLLLLVMNSELRLAIKDRIRNDYWYETQTGGMVADEELVAVENSQKPRTEQQLGLIEGWMKGEDGGEAIICDGKYEVEMIAGENSACSAEKQQIQNAAFQPGKHAADAEEPKQEATLENARKWAEAWNPVSPEDTDNICAYVARDEVEDSDSYSILETVSELYSYIRVPRILSPGSPSPRSELSVAIHQEVGASVLEMGIIRESILEDVISVTEMEEEGDSSILSEKMILKNSVEEVQVHASQLPVIPKTVQFEIPGSTLKRRNQMTSFANSSLERSPSSSFSDACGSAVMRSGSDTFPEYFSVLAEAEIDRYATVGPIARPSGAGQHGRFLPTTVPAQLKELQDSAMRLARSVKEKYKGEWV